MSKKRELLFSLTKDDFEVQTFRSGGKGGQHQNKTESGVRIIHPASGAAGECREERSQFQNKKRAFERLVASKKFRDWHRIEVARALGRIMDTEKWVEEQMSPENILIESYDPVAKKWVPLEEIPNKS